MHVELLVFPDCPHAENARRQLRRAFELVELPASWSERDISAPGTSNEVAAFGSPTILVDGHDVDEAPTRAGVTCRIYAGSELTGAPRLNAIVAALRKCTPT
ncbi:MAG: hypothetical protein ACAI38_22945 [Myxococcota bacterium]|nr:hypothetical protein [Myxococcota bacterium]